MRLTRFLTLLVCLVMLASCALAEGSPALPIDFTGGMPAVESCYTGEYAYEDPTISVTIETGREYNCDFWVARIRIADPSQLRTMSADGFDSQMTMSGPAMARRVNAVLAIDGDYFCYTGFGYIMRQGELFLDQLAGDRDVLLIDEDGDFHVLYKPQPGSIDGTVNGKKIINAFYFGPALVVDGEIAPDVTGSDMAQDQGRQRMCIAQVGPLEYMAICCAGPARGSNGMTLKQFATLVHGFGVQTAYNLDGGDSTMLIWKGEKINDVRNNSTRNISDIIYFASAYDPEEAAE